MPTAAELRAALLTPADLPPGYATQSLNGSGLGNSSLLDCPALTNDPTGVEASASVNLADTGTGSSVSETLLQLSAGDAAKAMAAFAAMPTNCRSFSGELDTYKVTFGTAPLPVSPLGNQTTASRITGTISAAGAAIYVDVEVVRYGGTLIVLSCVGLTVSTAFTEQTAGAAYHAIAARW